jgi:hypothetical protein
MLRMDDVLYHYTNSRGLLGIFETNTLRATGSEWMNDREELRRGVEIIGDHLGKLLQTDPDDEHLSAINNRFHKHSFNDDAYIACLSAAGDSLDLWRAYATEVGFVGFAIGFDKRYLTSNVIPNNHEATLEQVVYGEAADLIKESDAIISASESEVACGGDLLRLAARFKASPWKGEQEWRIVVVACVERRQPNFRAGAYGLIPYIDIELGAARVKEIVVGPGAYAEERGRATQSLIERYCRGASLVDSKIGLR